MARIRTAYVRDDEGRVRRGDPDQDRDIGATSAATDGLAALGRLSATRLDPYLQADAAHAAGAGPVERRQETPEERAAREVRDSAAAMRGLRVAVARAPKPSTARTAPQPNAAPAVAPVIHEEETVTVIATIEPAEALPAIPCASCVHTAVCRIQPMVEQAMYAVAQLGNAGDPAVRIRSTVECDHHLVAEPAHKMSGVPTTPEPAVEEPPIVARVRSTPEELQASRQRGAEATSKVYAERRERVLPAELTPRQQQVLDTVQRHAGDRRAAALELGIQYQSVDVTLESVAAKGLIPDGLLEKLPPRFRRPAQAAVAS